MGEVLLLIGLAALALSVVSLITPKLAFFLKNKTRAKAFGSYLGIALISIIVGSSAMQNPVSNIEIASQNDKTAETKSEPAKPATFKYRENYIRNRTDRHNRIRGCTVYISPLDEEADLNVGQITATCMAAAKYYAEDFSKKYNSHDNTLVDDIAVVITDMPYDMTKDIKYGNLGKLAGCNYMLGKSTGLFSYGEPEWQWRTVVASPRNTNSLEKKIESLWVNLQDKFKQGNRLRENDLINEIAYKLNLTPDQINIPAVLPEKVDSEKYINIQPHGPDGNALN